MQAIGFLSRREHSRQELRIKLLAAARERERARERDLALDHDDAVAGPAADGVEADPAAEVDALLDWLEAHGYLSDARFVESRVHAREARQGGTRIRHELARHGLVLEPAQAATLRETEFARAQAIWQRKFGSPGADARERARQSRFLAARGFAADVVRRVTGGEDEFP